MLANRAARKQDYKLYRAALEAGSLQQRSETAPWYQTPSVSMHSHDAHPRRRPQRRTHPHKRRRMGMIFYSVLIVCEAADVLIWASGASLALSSYFSSFVVSCFSPAELSAGADFVSSLAGSGFVSSFSPLLLSLPWLILVCFLA